MRTAACACMRCSIEPALTVSALCICCMSVRAPACPVLTPTSARACCCCSSSRCLRVRDRVACARLYKAHVHMSCTARRRVACLSNASSSLGRCALTGDFTCTHCGLKAQCKRKKESDSSSFECTNENTVEGALKCPRGQEQHRYLRGSRAAVVEAAGLCPPSLPRQRLDPPSNAVSASARNGDGEIRVRVDVGWAGGTRPRGGTPPPTTPKLTASPPATATSAGLRLPDAGAASPGAADAAPALGSDLPAGPDGSGGLAEAALPPLPAGAALDTAPPGTLRCCPGVPSSERADTPRCLCRCESKASASLPS